jgi:hypothetical protein
MFGFVYRCPTTGHKVQGFVQDHPSTLDDASIYETVTCASCRRVHLVSPSSGHVAGTNREHAEAVIGQRPQSSSASRLTAGAAGFLTLTQQSARPER